MTAMLGHLWRIVRRRPRTTALGVVLLVLFVIPVVPFTPACGWIPGDYWPVKGEMTEEYRHVVKAHFESYGVYYWDIGGIILLRALPGLDGSDGMDHYDGILNAERKAAWALAEERYVATFVGMPWKGGVYQVPPHIEALRDPETGDFDVGSCELMYAAVTGKPMPPELGKYPPRPKFR